MRLLLIVNVMIKKMPKFSFGHYHQNKCAINHYLYNDSIILLWYFFMLPLFCKANDELLEQYLTYHND